MSRSRWKWTEGTGGRRSLRQPRSAWTGTVLFGGFLTALFSLSLAATPSVEEILARHAEALGGVENLFRPRSLHARGHISASGLKGTIEAWVEGTDRSERFRQELDLGLIKMTLGCDGRDWWRVDNNGAVGDIGGAEKDKLTATLYIGDYLYLHPQASRSRIELAGSEDRDGVPTFVLDVDLPGGESRRLWIEADTYLPYGYEEVLMGVDMFVRVSDFREVDGIMLPLRTEMISENPLFNQTQVFESIEKVSSIDPDLFRRPAAGGRDFHFVGGGEAIEVPMILHDTHVFVEVRLNDEIDANFLLDTGAGASCLSFPLARKLGIEGEGELGTIGIGGSEASRMAQVSSIRVGDLLLERQNVVVIDLAGLEFGEGKKIDGILGYDFFRRLVVDIDYEKEVLRLADPATFTFGGEGDRIALSLDFNVPIAQASLEDSLSGGLIVDTGNAHDLFLHKSFLEETGLGRHRPSLDLASAGVGGTKEMRLIRLSGLRVGDTEVPGPLAMLPKSDDGAAGIEMAIGNLGAGVLRRFRVIFNYEAGELILIRPGGFDPLSTVEISGGLLRPTEGGLLIVQILDGSPIDEAGLKPRDIVLEIDGVTCEGLESLEFQALVDVRDGRVVPVIYRRDGDRKVARMQVTRVL